MRTEEVTDGSRLSAATRFESLVGVSNAIGMHRDPQELFGALLRELHRVVRFDYIGVSIRDEKSNTFHRIPSTRRQKHLSLRTPNWPWRNPMPGGSIRTKSLWSLRLKPWTLGVPNFKRF